MMNVHNGGNLRGFSTYFRYSDRLFAVVLFVATALISLPMFINSPVLAQDRRIVTVHVDDITTSFVTDATTVGQVLDRAKVTLNDKDLVEPSPDTEISVDSFNINVYRARPVTVVDGNNKVHLLSPYQSPRLIAQSAGFTIYPEDILTMDRVNNFIAEGTIGLRVNIIRATKLKLNYYGTSSDIRTQAKTVGDLLKERGIDSAQADVIRPSLSEPIRAGMTVYIVKTGSGVVVEEESVPFNERVILDSNRLVGSRSVQTPGVVGSRLVTYQVDYENDKEISRKRVESVITAQPKEQVVVVGTRVHDPSDSIEVGQSLAAQRGWTGDQWTCLYNLWMRESNWNYQAQNPSSGAFGIPQALPGSKMSSAGDDWQTNPATQITWGLDYIDGRYGTPCNAWNFFSSHLPHYY